MARKGSNMWVLLIVILIAYAFIPSVQKSINSIFEIRTSSTEEQGYSLESSGHWPEELIYNIAFLLVIVLTVLVIVLVLRRRKKVTNNKNKRRSTNKEVNKNVKANQKDISSD